MKLTISKQALSSALSTIKPAIPSRTTMEILQNVLLRAESDTLTVIGTDNTVSIMTQATANIIDPGEVTVNFHKLNQITSSMVGDISLTVDNNFLIVKQGRSRFKLHTLPASTFQDLPETKDNELSFVSKDFIASINSVSHAVSKNDIIPIVSGINIGANGFSATDGRAIVSLSRNNNINQNITISPKTAQIICSSAKENINITFNQNVINFHTETAVIKSRLIDGTYPDVTKITNQPLSDTISCNLPELIHAIRSVSIITDDRYNKVTLTSNNDILSVSAYNGEEASIDISCVASNNIDKSFDANYLLSLLGACVNDDLTIEFENGNGKPMRINDNNNVHVLAGLNG